MSFIDKIEDNPIKSLVAATVIVGTAYYLYNSDESIGLPIIENRTDTDFSVDIFGVEITGNTANDIAGNISDWTSEISTSDLNEVLWSLPDTIDPYDVMDALDEYGIEIG